MSETLKGLRKYLVSLPTGKVANVDQLAVLLTACRDEFSDDESGMLWFWDEGRAHNFVQDVVWTPPELIFEINPDCGGACNKSRFTSRWSVNIDAVSISETGELENILEGPFAKKLAAKIGRERLRGLLRRIAEEPPREPGARELMMDSAKSLGASCRKWAKRIRDAKEPLDPSSIVVDMPISVLTPAEYDEWQTVPKVLEHFAQMWEAAHKRIPYSSKEDPRAGSITDLVAAVRDAIGSAHYREIADVVDEINSIPEYHHPSEESRDAVATQRLVSRYIKKMISMIPKSQPETERDAPSGKENAEKVAQPS